ncbi:MAG: preprotein translocase subunit SecG [Planctomycetaceae bacterium]|nr:preprotein translocase subunit SecG [Planctomycetaceae bacterium]
MTALIRFFLGFSLVLTSLFLILLVLIQRGRGGGLAGAFGGAGGQSAFGTKAGDVFTKITVAVAAFWILLCILSLNVLGRQSSLFSPTLGGSAPQGTAPVTPPAGGPAAPEDMTPATPETKPVTPDTKPAAQAAPAAPEQPAAAPAAPESPASAPAAAPADAAK